MISMSVISSAGGTSKYMTEQSAVEYYAGEKAPNQWQGQGAEIQGLAGREVSTAELTSQLEGKVDVFNKASGEWEEKQLGVWRVPKDREYSVGVSVKFLAAAKEDGIVIDGGNVNKGRLGVVESVDGEFVTVKLEDSRTVEVDIEKFEKLAVWEHRAGWDLTFAAPKSVSIESEVFGNADVRAAHESAVAKAMAFLEDKAAQTRVDGEMVKTGNMTYATFGHATSRAGDPQTHTHVVIANVTFHDGKAYSLSNEKLMDFRTTADAVYKNELANALEKAGFQLEWDKKGNFEIAGYSKDNLDTFSKRSEQIKDALAEHGLDKDTASHAARQAAALDTRVDKNHPEHAEAHRDKWQKEAEAAGIKQVERQPVETISYGEQMQSARDAVTSAINHLTEREQAFNDKDLWKEAARFVQGAADTDKIYSAINEQLKIGALIGREDGKFTTLEAVNAEKFMAEHLVKGHGAHEAVVSHKEFDVALTKFESRKEQEITNSLETKISTARASGDVEVAASMENKLAKFKEEGFHLTHEQRDASRMILTGDDRFQGVQGLAGTGKTTMLEFVKEAAESKGWEVKGFSNGGAQADKMQAESGITSTTTARHLIDSDKTARDADLAQRALDTLNKHSGTFGKEPNFRELDRQVDKGLAKLEYDSDKRAFYTDKQGDTWTKGLYEKTTELTSANINHAGLTDTKYIISDKGVFKSGGSIGSEFAGAMKEKFNEGERSDSVAAKVGHWAADKYLTKGEDWKKCDAVESASVRAAAAIQTPKDQAAEYSALKEQASQANGTNQKVLHVCDEASMSGQREFNRVIEATEQQGARTVFLGDENQHQAVEAGKGFELAQDHMTTSELGKDSIRRQTTDPTIDAVSKILEGQHGEAMKGLNTKEQRSHQDVVREKFAEIESPTTKDKADFRADMKVASELDNKEVIKELSKDYSNMDKGDRDKTLVITSNNDDRRAINSEVRDNLKAQGELQDGKQIDTLSSTGMTKEDASRAINYEAGQVVEFTRDYRSQGFEKGMQGTVESVDNRTNTVNLKMDDGRNLSFNPAKVEGKEVFNEQKGREFAEGDKVAFTKNDKELNVKNGQTGTIEKFDGKDMTVKMENGEKREFSTEDYKHIDHAYAVTSYKSQGQDFDNVMVHHNTDAAGMHNARETYVNVTRAREDVTYYTQDAIKAAKQAGEELNKESAILKPEQAKEAVSEKAIEAKPDHGKEREPAKLSPEFEKAIAQAEQSIPQPSTSVTEQSKAEAPQTVNRAERAMDREAAGAPAQASATEPAQPQTNELKGVEQTQPESKVEVRESAADNRVEVGAEIKPETAIEAKPDHGKERELSGQQGLDIASAAKDNAEAIKDFDRSGVDQPGFNKTIEAFEKNFEAPGQEQAAAPVQTHEMAIERAERYLPNQSAQPEAERADTLEQAVARAEQSIPDLPTIVQFPDQQLAKDLDVEGNIKVGDAAMQLAAEKGYNNVDVRGLREAEKGLAQELGVADAVNTGDAALQRAATKPVDLAQDADLVRVKEGKSTESQPEQVKVDDSKAIEAQPGQDKAGEKPELVKDPAIDTPQRSDFELLKEALKAEERDIEQERSGASRQVSGGVEAKGKDGETVKETESEKSKSAGKETKKQPSSRGPSSRSRDMEMER